VTSNGDVLLVLDSASLYFRSYYALPSSMTAPDGRPHNAIRGFLTTLTRLVEAYEPTQLVAAWDVDWRPAWRVELVPSYKAHRVADDGADDDPGGIASGPGEAEPEDLGPQAEAIAEIMDALGIARWGASGYEADDIIGTVAARHTADALAASQMSTDRRSTDRRSMGLCVVVSGDRDLVQVIDPVTRLLLTVNGGMEKWPLLGVEETIDRFAVAPDQYVDMAVLRGDPSDGLPGVPGVGAKTAVALVQAFGGLDGVIGAAHEAAIARPLTPRIAERIRACCDELHRARTVTQVVRDVPVPALRPDIPGQPVDEQRLDALASEWGVGRQVTDLRRALGQTVPE